MARLKAVFGLQKLVSLHEVLGVVIRCDIDFILQPIRLSKQISQQCFRVAIAQDERLVQVL